jgi:hypothetical protein
MYISLLKLIKSSLWLLNLNIITTKLLLRYVLFVWEEFKTRSTDEKILKKLYYLGYMKSAFRDVYP